MSNIDEVSLAIGSLTSDVRAISGIVTANGEVMLEVRDLARETNGRVTRMEATVADHAEVIALVRKATLDEAAVHDFLASWRGKVTLVALVFGGLASTVAAVATLVP